MKKTLADMFKASRGEPVNYGDRLVHAAVFRKVIKPSAYIVRFILAIPKPMQGLGIAIDQGNLTVEETTAKRIALWYDSSPRVVTVRYRPSTDGGRLSIYNVWEDENGGIDAWLMNAGMLVEEAGNKMTLRCSDGLGEPTFDDLIVEIEFLED
jgi:hypothetical protein